MTFEVEAVQQLRHLTGLFRAADRLPDYGLSDAQIYVGLWCVLGGAHNKSFISLVWNSALPIGLRRGTIAALNDLYDRLLAASEGEVIDFRHPDTPPRRFQKIDNMALALVVEAIAPLSSTACDRSRVRAALPCVLGRLLEHSSLIAQHAVLHCLGHLRSKQRIQVIDRYLATRCVIEGPQREYALSARAGTLL